MDEESKRITNTAEVIKFGQDLNGFHDSDLTFEMKDDAGRMKSCSLNDVIMSFQSFSDGKTNRFKVWITYADMSVKRIEFERLIENNTQRIKKGEYE
jgi:hypothetical protein